MSDKINQYKWLPWGIAVIIVIGIAILGSGYANWFLLEPWAPAATFTTELSIDAFSAGERFNTYVQDVTPSWHNRLTIVAAIIFTFILGPSLWVYAEMENQDSKSKDVLKKGVLWYVGAVVVISSLQVVPTAIIKGIVFENTWESAAQSATKDELRTDLMKLGYEALEFYHLPHDKGGGGNSFQKRSINPDEWTPIQIADLKKDMQLSNHSYVVKVANSDSMLTIRGIGAKQGDNAHSDNADGGQEKVEMALQVKPPATFEFSTHNIK